MQPGSQRTLSTKMAAAKEGEAATKKEEGVVLNPDFKFNMEDVVSVCKRRGFIFQVGCAWPPGGMALTRASDLGHSAVAHRSRRRSLFAPHSAVRSRAHS
jgi:hypothetical protein